LIAVVKRIIFLEPTLSLSTLTDFFKLNHVIVPQALLLGVDVPLPNAENFWITTLLPLSLESLEIVYPIETVFDFLEQAVENHEYFSALHHSKLRCDDKRGIVHAKHDGMGGMLALWNKEPVI
jgi:hypothetical protein